MMMQQMKDERVEQAKHKIYAELMLISYGIIVVSYCIKAIYFEMSMRQCATEFIILIWRRCIRQCAAGRWGSYSAM